MGGEGTELEKGWGHEKSEARGRSLFLLNFIKSWGWKKEDDSRKRSSPSIFEREREYNRWTWEDKSAIEGTYWTKVGIVESAKRKHCRDSKVNRF